MSTRSDSIQQLRDSNAQILAKAQELIGLAQNQQSQLDSIRTIEDGGGQSPPSATTLPTSPTEVPTEPQVISGTGSSVTPKQQPKK